MAELNATPSLDVIAARTIEHYQANAAGFWRGTRDHDVRQNYAALLDGCEAFVTMARAHSGCEVLQQSFFELELGERQFDGVFANASLFHVPRVILPRVLSTLFEALAPGGVLFCSNPRSFHSDDEGWEGDRYGSYLTIESWVRVISTEGFVLERHFLRPSAKPPSEQPWLAMVWRKPS